MSNSDPPTYESPDDYRVVLDLAGRVIAAVRDLERDSPEGPAGRWAMMRRQAAEAEAAALGEASAHGRLVDYEAAIRGLIGEAIPLEEAPTELKGQAETAIAQLELLATEFQRRLPARKPAANAVSLELRRAGRNHAARNFAAVDHLTLERIHERAAATVPDTPARSSWTSPDGSRHVEVQHGEKYLELWVVDEGIEGPPLLPMKLSGLEKVEILYALLAPRAESEGSGRSGYFSVVFEEDSVRVDFGEPVLFSDLDPTDAPALLASINATGRSWRDLWRAYARGIPWLAALAQALPEHERD